MAGFKRVDVVKILDNPERSPFGRESQKYAGGASSSVSPVKAFSCSFRFLADHASHAQKHAVSTSGRTPRPRVSRGNQPEAPARDLCPPRSRGRSKRRSRLDEANPSRTTSRKALAPSISPRGMAGQTRTRRAGRALSFPSSWREPACSRPLPGQRLRPGTCGKREDERLPLSPLLRCHGVRRGPPRALREKIRAGDHA